jgi:hypothetical protein
MALPAGGGCRHPVGAMLRRRQGTPACSAPRPLRDLRRRARVVRAVPRGPPPPGGRGARRPRSLRRRAEPDRMAARHLQLEAANVRRQTNDNFGFVAEHDMERKFREPQLPQVTPVPTKMVPAPYGFSWHCRCCRRGTSGCSTRLRLVAAGQLSRSSDCGGRFLPFALLLGEWPLHRGKPPHVDDQFDDNAPTEAALASDCFTWWSSGGPDPLQPVAEGEQPSVATCKAGRLQSLALVRSGGDRLLHRQLPRRRNFRRTAMAADAQARRSAGWSPVGCIVRQQLKIAAGNSTTDFRRSLGSGLCCGPRRTLYRRTRSPPLAPGRS